MNNQLNNLFVSYKPVKIDDYPYIEQSNYDFINWKSLASNLPVTYKPVKVINYPNVKQFNQPNYIDNYTNFFIDTSQLPITNQLPIIKQNKSNYNFTSWKPLASNQIIQNNNLANMSFEDLVRTYKLPIKISSGYRGKNGFRGGKTKSGKQSNHNKLDAHGHPMAYDIQPLVNGKVDKSDSAFANLRNILANNQNVREWFKMRNWGILDETTPYMMAKTGATGKHFHIGPDRAAIRFS